MGLYIDMIKDVSTHASVRRRLGELKQIRSETQFQLTPP